MSSSTYNRFYLPIIPTQPVLFIFIYATLQYTSSNSGCQPARNYLKLYADQCVDESDYSCARRAVTGECETNKRYMIQQCRLTCGYCQTELPPQPTRPPRGKCHILYISSCKIVNGRLVLSPTKLFYLYQTLFKILFPSIQYCI